MNLLEENQPTDLEQLIGLSRRGFIGAGALCGAALFLGGGLLSRSALAALGLWRVALEVRGVVMFNSFHKSNRGQALSSFQS